MSEALLVEGGYVYTADEKNTRYEAGSVLAVDGVIVAVGDRIDVPAGVEPRVIDASSMMVLPGLVNAHWHCALGDALIASHPEANLWKERPDPFDESADQPGVMSGDGEVRWLSQYFGGHRRRTPPTVEEATAFAEYAVWTQLRSGITAFGDAGSTVPPEVLLAATRKVGIRAAVSVDGTDGQVTDAGFGRTAALDDVVPAIEAFLSEHPADGRTKAMVASKYVVSTSDELGRAIAGLIERHDTSLITHVGCFSEEIEVSRQAFGRTPIARLAELGLLTDRLIAVHCGFVTDDEAGLLADSGAHVNYSPAKYATSGESTVSRGRVFGDFIKRGGPISLSTDGLVLPLGGMVEAMQQAWQLHNQLDADNTSVLPTTALRMATRNAAAALRWDHEIGSLEVGKQADLTLIPIDDWRYLLRPRPLDGLLLLGSSNDVQTVIVAGAVVLSEGRSTLVDESALRQRFLDACRSRAVRDWAMTPDQLRRLDRYL